MLIQGYILLVKSKKFQIRLNEVSFEKYATPSPPWVTQAACFHSFCFQSSALDRLPRSDISAYLMSLCTLRP